VARRASAAEISLVLGLPTAIFLAGCVVALMRGPGSVVFTDARLLRITAEEAITAALFLPFLRHRGWTPDAIGGAPEPMDVVRGGLVCLGSYVAYYLAFVALLSLAPSWGTTLQATRIGGSVSVPVAVVTALLNPLFEEFLWLGYGVSALEPRIGLRGACIVSVVLRVAVHSYQGPMALVGIAPMAVVFTWYYARTGRLWPLIVAHVIGDAAAFGVLAASKH
jgi:membrane protease YdiL (CAAX protease family)